MEIQVLISTQLIPTPLLRIYYSSYRNPLGSDTIIQTQYISILPSTMCLSIAC